MDRPSSRRYGFIQLEGFSIEWDRLGLTDDDLIALEAELAQDPGAWPTVAGTGGLRKARFAPPSWRTGRSGRVRVGFYFRVTRGLVFLMLVYAKKNQSAMTARENAEAKETIAWIERRFA